MKIEREIPNVPKEERSQLQEGCDYNLNFKTIWRNLIIPVLCFIFVILGFISSYNIGYRNGSDYGFVTALDTVHKICEKQINNDSVVTKLVLVKKDTVAYILESKEVLEK